jgi:hypothetical protein
VTNVNVTVVHNTYNQTVINNNVTVNRVSYNGGSGGITARANPVEETAARERHITPTTEQTQHERAAGSNHALLASANHGQPPVAATAKPGVFSGREVVAARGAGPNARESGRAATPAPARGEARPAPRTENSGASAGPNSNRPERAGERPQIQQPRGRPNDAPEPRAKPAPKPNHQAAPREKRNEGDKGEERR